MALRVSKLIVMGAEAATMVCFLKTPAATISVWIWPDAPIDQTRLNGRCRDVAAIFDVHLTSSWRSIAPPNDCSR